jgi:ribonuclease D
MTTPQLISSIPEYQAMISALQGQPSIGVDTESNSLFAYREQVCLLQLSNSDQDFIVDPFPLDGMPELGQIFADPAIQKIFHAGDYDIACLKRDYGYEFHNLFDTMLAAATLGETNLGLAAMLEKYLGIVVDKKYQRADWGKRPIRPEMLAYAQNDSHYLIPLRDQLQEALINTGKLDLLLEDSRNLARTPSANPEPEVSVWHVRGAQELKPIQLSLLQALMMMREDLAENLDRPLFKVLGDASLVDLARVQPHYIEELDLLPTLSAGQVKAFGKNIMVAIEEWRRNPDQVEKRQSHRPSDAELQRRDLLSTWRKEEGKKMGVSSNIVLSKDLIEDIARTSPKNAAELKVLMVDYPCRYDLLSADILKALQKETL